jgi:hypothetical protein
MCDRSKRFATKPAAWIARSSRRIEMRGDFPRGRADFRLRFADENAIKM